MRAAGWQQCLRSMDVLRPSASRMRMSVDEYGIGSFVLRGVTVRGSVLVFPTFALKWNVDRPEQISPQSLVALQLLHPRPEFLLLGLGNGRILPPDVFMALRQMRIPFEVADTPTALNTFNVLNAEGRLVCAGLLPVTQLNKQKSGGSKMSSESPV